MASCLRMITSLQLFSGVPVIVFVIIKTRGQAKGKISCGAVTSNTIRCFPVILLNQASGSSSAGKENFSDAATTCNGTDNDAMLTAPAPKANVPKKPRRSVVGLELFNCINFNF